MLRVTLIAVALVVAAAMLALWLGARRWHAAGEDVQQRLLVAPPAARATTFSPSELDGLPPPVSGYLRQVLRDGQPIAQRVRITWRGQFNMGAPGADRWKPFEAVQEYVVDPPGFVWDARIAMLPGVPVLVRDSFAAGAGGMHGAIAGLVTVVRSEGTPGIAVAALQRHLGEATWFPTALLPSQGVQWQDVGARQARATLSSGGVTASLEFRFGADGLVEATFIPDRMFDNGRDPPVPHPWQARNLRWGEVDGQRVPLESVAEWLLPGGTWAYWRGGPVRIESLPR